MNEEVPTYLDGLEKRINLNKGSHFLVGNDWTIADFTWIAWAYTFVYNPAHEHQ